MTPASLDELLRTAVSRHGGRTALVHAGLSTTYEDLAAHADALADRLRRGCGGGASFPARATVAVLAPNAPLAVLGMLAAWRLGAVAVPLDARLRGHELTEILSDAEPVAVVSVGAHRGYSFRRLLVELLPELPSVRRCLVADAHGRVEEELAGRGEAPPAGPGDDVAALLYTSGTTGVPKGALVLHERELSAARELAAAVALRTGDTAALPIPVAHAFGLSCLIATLAAGATAVLTEVGFSPRAFLHDLARAGATLVHGSPTLFATLLKARPDGVSGLRAGFVGGASAAPELFERLDRVGTRVLNVYGLTETGVVARCRLDDPPDVRYDTAGAPLPQLEVRLDRGELLVRGQAVTPGYHRNAAETAAAFTGDGWFRTGDLAQLGPALRVVGRRKELAHVGGFNVFPSEVEGVLLTHPDVSQAVVVAVPHETLGSTLRAYVTVRDGAQATPAALVGFMRERVAGYKVPYSIETRRELPLLASGKPDRRALARRGA